MHRSVALCTLLVLFSLLSGVSVFGQGDQQLIEQWLDEGEYLLRRQPKQALQKAGLALNLALEKGWEHEIATSSLLLGRAHWQLGDYLAALAFFQDAKHKADEVSDPLIEAAAWSGLSQVAWRLGDYSQAYLDQQRALALREENKDTVGVIQSLYWVGVLQADLHEYGSAREFYRRSYALAESRADSQTLANLLNQEARSWRKQEVYDTALVLHKKSLAIFEALHDSLGISDYYNNVGSIYRRMGNYPLALQHFFAAIHLQEQLHDLEGLADGYNDIGTTYSQFGEYDSALLYLKKGLALARSGRLIDDVRYAYESLAVTYDLMGDYQQALASYRAYSEVRESIMNEQQAMHTALLTTAFEEEKAQELALRQARMRSLWAIFLGILSISGLVGAFLWWRMRWQRRVNHELAEKNLAIESEQKRSEALLQNILPVSVAQELKEQAPHRAIARNHDEVTVLFIDFANFTQISERLGPAQLVNELHQCFQAFDEITMSNGLEKIKTIGDAYMCAGGLPEPSGTHAADAIRAALAMQAFLVKHNQFRLRQNPDAVPFWARIGIHSGPVVAGVVGSRKFAYDIWGDTVNTAARMEAAGEVGRVNISQDTYERVQTEFICRYRGKVHAKHKGEIDMYFVEWEI